jgi:hypothetical protein
MRRSLLASGLSALATLAALFAAACHRSNSGSLPAVVPGVAYTVDVDRDQATVDLDFPPNARYTVIISSLARNTGIYTVAASSHFAAALENPPRKLEPLRSPVTSPEPRTGTACANLTASRSSK